MAAAVSTPVNPKTTPAASGRRNQNPIRPPLLPSEPDNALAPRRPKCSEVTSRYMSSSSSSTAKRSPSPLTRSGGTISPTPPASSTTKRAQSTERRRPASTRSNFLDSKFGSCNGVEVPNAQRILVTSARSLSVSFQGESFSVQVSKAKPAPSPIGARKGTPERRKGTPIPARGGHQVDNSRPVEQQRWPGRLRQPNSMSRSMDWGDNKGRLIGSGVNANSLVHYRSSNESRSRSNSTNIGSEKSDHPVNSDSESVSSCSTSESAGCAGDGRAQLQRARFWQESGDRLCRQPEPASPVSGTVVVLRRIEPPKFISTKKFGIDSKIISPKGIGNTRGQLSPIRGGALRPTSPKPATTSSPIRGASPSRVRNSVGAVVNSNLSNLNNTASVLSFAADIRRTKSGEHQMVEVHVLRILYNRLLQWRFANARADSALSAQKSNAEVNLHSALVTTSQLLELVRARRRKLQWLRQNLKIISILKGQIVYLEELAIIDRDFSNSMSGAIEALQASTIRLPVVGGARADIQKVKDAICSAVDVMQAMASSICLLLSKVSGVNSLVAELVNVAGKERALLGRCNHLLSVISAVQVRECSLRTHFLQVERDFPA